MSYEGLKLGLVFGGMSEEHQVSVMSAVSVMEHYNKAKYQLIPIGITEDGRWIKVESGVDSLKDGSWCLGEEINVTKLPEIIDFALLLTHGRWGEDGKLQGLLEFLKLPYGGCGVLGSAVGMDKAMAKDVLKSHNIDVCKYMVVYDVKPSTLENVVSTLGFPVFVKPANGGSSLGISKAQNMEQLILSINDALFYDRRVLIEEAVSGREIETAIMGNRPEALTAGGIGEIVSAGDFYDYEAKYLENQGTKLIIGPQMDPSQEALLLEMAKKTYMVLDLTGFARIDFFVEEGGRVMVNEVNTLPGFTKYSMFPRLMEAAGMSYQEIIEKIVELGYERCNFGN